MHIEPSMRSMQGGKCMAYEDDKGADVAPFSAPSHISTLNPYSHHWDVTMFYSCLPSGELRMLLPFQAWSDFLS